MAVAHKALECIVSAAGNASAGASPAAAAEAAAAACMASAAAADATLWNETFNAPCARLPGGAQCTARPGCVLQAHDDHFDCVRALRSVADFLGGGVLADAVQRAADACRGPGVSPAAGCGAPPALLSLQSVREAAASMAFALREGNASAPLPSDEDHDHDHDHGDNDVAQELSDESLGLRIASVFIVLVAGLVGGMLPVLMRVWGPPCTCMRLRASGGPL